MNRRSAVRKSLATGAGPFLAYLTEGRSRSDEHQPANYTLRSDVRLVLLDVSVTDQHGNFVSGLSQDNFSVFENGEPQEISVFDHDDLPVTVGILVDESRSMTPKRADVMAAAEALLKGHRQDQIFVLHFNDRVTPGLPQSVLFFDDVQQLQEALLRGVPEGKTALNDAIVSALKQLELGDKEKKTLVVISDGGDNASQHQRDEMLAMVEKSLATIYTVGLFEPDDPEQDPALLRCLSRTSGGEAYFPVKSEDITLACRRIAKEIRERYTIGYRPPDSHGKRSLRHIRVLASTSQHAKLMVRTRTSYRYEEDEE
jgi:Ca-activated chloride channel homolog